MTDGNPTIKERLREQGREYMRKRRKENPELRERERKYRREYYQRNKEKIRSREKESRRKLRRQVIEMMGDKCVICGFDDWRGLQIDHINGGGTKEFKKLWADGIYRKIRDNPHLIGVEYQLLCATHNQIKRYENKEDEK